MTSTVVPIEVGALSEWVRDHLPDDLADKWPRRFRKAVRPGADLSGVWDTWCAWMLDRLVDDAPPDADMSVVRDIRSLFRDPATVRPEQWEQARDAARDQWDTQIVNARRSEAACWAAWSAEAARTAIDSRFDWGAGTVMTAGAAASFAGTARTEWIWRNATYAEGEAQKRLERLWYSTRYDWAVDVANALIELVEAAPVVVTKRGA